MTAAADRRLTLGAAAFSCVAAAVALRFSTFVPWGTDAAAYVEAGYRWADGQLFEPSTFRFWAAWAIGEVESPFGSRPAPIDGTIVSTYPLGYPLLLAAALTLGGWLGPYLVAPLCAGVLTWCTFLLGRVAGGAGAGLAGAFLVAASPVTFANATQPMSDVPATALWAVSWLVALRAGRMAALASGLAAAMAFMIRPVLAPLAIVIALVVLTVNAVPRRWGCVVWFGVAGAIGPGILLWSQAEMYGHPLASGYAAADQFFRVERIPHNAIHYWSLLRDTHTWLPALGVLAVPIALVRARRSGDRRMAIVVVSAASILVANVAVYLPYLTFPGWYWLRFLLPGLVALFILFAILIEQARSWLAARSRWLAVAAVVPILFVAGQARPQLEETMYYGPLQRRVQQMGHYLRNALPSNAVILTYLQSAAATMYTGRPLVRLDAIQPNQLDTAIRDLWRRGYEPVVLVDLGMEGDAMRSQFAGQEFGALDWSPRAIAWSGSAFTAFNPRDRQASLNNEQVSLDDVSWPLQAGGVPDPPAPGDAARAFPATHETIAFRQILELTYRDTLARTPSPGLLDHSEASIWTRRYLRYRLTGCGHDDAVRRVLTQFDGPEVMRACGHANLHSLPPRNDTVDFRIKLEEKYSGLPRRSVRPAYIDLEGDAVWTQEYIVHRLSGHSHEEAVEHVLRQIRGPLLNENR